MQESVFTHDVLLSHSSKDKAVVRPIAERLRQDGLKVWFDEWECPSPAGAGEGGRRAGEGRGAKGDSIPAKIDPPSLRSYGGTGEGLEHSRVVPLAHRMGEGARRAGEGCMSAHAFGSNWAQLARPPKLAGRRRKADTCGRGNLPFRAPQNKERHFIPLQLDDAPIKGPLARFLYINWLPADRERDITDHEGIYGS